MSGVPVAVSVAAARGKRAGRVAGRAGLKPVAARVAGETYSGRYLKCEGDGGPATVYGARAFDAFSEFYAERAAQQDGRQLVG